MAFFEKLGDTLVKAGKDVTEKTKEISGTTKLKMDIRSKEEFLEKQYALIGRKCYEEHKNDDVLPFEECSVIEEALQSIADMKAQLLEIRGAKVCPNCGEEVPEGSAFCANCGTKLEVASAKAAEPEEAVEPEKEVYEGDVINPDGSVQETAAEEPTS